MCYRRLGDVAENAVTEKLKQNLESAHIEMRAGAYLSYAWVNTVLAGTIAVLLYLSFIMLIKMELVITLLLAIFPALATLGIYLYYMHAPGLKARARGKKIDLHLPYALNFISAMSSAGITPTEIFKSLSKQDIYGEIRDEALWIYRDVSLLGKDIISAIKANINRTPSAKFKEFLQGAVVTVQSGGSLKPYFMAKADQYMRENRLAQKQLIESLGIMAECYVTAAVAGILLVIIIIPLMMMISQSGTGQLIIMNLFSFFVIPLIHVGFAVVIALMTTRV
ncbi:MAG: type II secretion system F family protein [Candidatus Thermoplasmatota archaeon]|jgi:flagellar protein FlaJ|nr:type II secretion system F family protein [Candidatus Thermoplasmatota archaeon]